MNLIESKETYLNELIDINEQHKRALSLAIDCVIDNESEGQDVPIVLTSYDDFCKDQISHLLTRFCEKIFPNSGISFKAHNLFIFGSDVESACDSLIRNMRRYEQSYIYLADSPTSFENLPSGLFHIVDIEYKKVTRYKNTRKGDVQQKKYEDEYSTDDFLSGLFDLVAFGERIKVSDATEASNLLFDECNACIIRPIPAPKEAEYSSKITISSPDWEKLACVALRRYQHRECRDGMSWDISNEGWKNVEAYPFTEKLVVPGTSEERDCLIGLVTMNINEGCLPLLSTVWLHPLFRRKGKLKNLWSDLKYKYGNFDVEQPNANMKAFMKAMSDSKKSEL